MLKSFSAFTHEIDDIEAAVAEIWEQLDLDGHNQLLKNTIGLVSCYAEFVESGVWAALCEKLPFEVIGNTTISNICAGELGETMLALVVLTSDEVSFATSLSAPVTAEEDIAPLRTMYQDALGKLPGQPSLMLSFAPLLQSFTTEFYIDSMNELSGQVPNFGTVVVDHNPDYHASQVLLNGEAWVDRYAIALIHGPIEPTFYLGTISREKISNDKSVVTASIGHQLQTVDGVPMIDYLQSLGLRKDEVGTVTGINSFPLVVDYNDGTNSMVITMFAVTPEGYAVCGSTVPVGASLSVGAFDEAEILATTRHTLGQALEAAQHNTILMYSCIGRYFALGYNNTAEFQALLDLLAGSEASYMAAYSGGELCPVSAPGGERFNRSHGNSFIVCAF